MDKEVMHKLKKMLCKQLEGYADIQNIGGKALEDVANMVKTIKNLEMIEGDDEGYGASQRGNFMGSYDDMPMSGRRGRDSMGRFVSREGNGGGSMRGSSYHDGVHDMTNQLRQMMRQSNDPEIQQALRQAMEQIDGMM